APERDLNTTDQTSGARVCRTPPPASSRHSDQPSGLPTFDFEVTSPTRHTSLLRGVVEEVVAKDPKGLHSDLALERGNGHTSGAPVRLATPDINVQPADDQPGDMDVDSPVAHPTTSYAQAASAHLPSTRVEVVVDEGDGWDGGGDGDGDWGDAGEGGGAFAHSDGECLAPEDEHLAYTTQANCDLDFALKEVLAHVRSMQEYGFQITAANQVMFSELQQIMQPGPVSMLSAFARLEAKLDTAITGKIKSNLASKTGESHEILSKNTPKDGLNKSKLGKSDSANVKSKNPTPIVPKRKIPSSQPKPVQPKQSPAPKHVFARGHPARLIIEVNPKLPVHEQLPLHQALVKANDALIEEGFEMQLSAVTYSPGGNIIAIVKPPHKGADLLGIPAEVVGAALVANPEDYGKFWGVLDEVWGKVLVNGILTRVGDMAITPDQVLEEMRDASPGVAQLLDTKGLTLKPRWLGTPAQLAEKHHTSMVFTFWNESTGRQFAKLIDRLPVFGYSCRVGEYRERKPPMICKKCCSFTHTTQFCQARSPKCAKCAGAHFTTQHECSECRDEDGGCEHLPFRCSNCQGNHPSTSPLCPKRQRVQPTSKTTAAPKQTSTLPKQSQPKPSQPNGGRAAPKQKKKTDLKGKGKAVEVVNEDGFETVPPRGCRPRV
ncbi:MAG TPA: hypothetical protein VHV10_21700, partial [Ktedonobacteraceae bacterium]|nr:hypothetical protein [Ktedonobacteraceae bacterium]